VDGADPSLHATAGGEAEDAVRSWAGLDLRRPPDFVGKPARARRHGVRLPGHPGLERANRRRGAADVCRYASEDEAITDGLRLSKGMTYKNALAGLPCGGGKSIILRQPGEPDRKKLFHAHGRLVNTLGGKYITAEDVGTSPSDMEFILKETQHVAGLQGRSGDPSPKTARGVFRAMQAAAKFMWGSDDLAGKTVAIQGCGHVGYYLAFELARVGAKIAAADVDEGKLNRVVHEFGARALKPAETDSLWKIYRYAGP